ncbi:MAG: hypothetical protein VB064_01250 [Oscillospiraceae bacterium]|nr:hypothetical protein [Oscillospiraceae bacterium]
MIFRMFDYHSAERQLLDEIQAKLAARTPEELAVDEKEASLSFQKIIEKHEEYAASHRRLPNRGKYEDFLSVAEQMRRYTAIHEGVITIRAEEGGTGIIEMYFDNIIHTDLDTSNSRLLFAFLLMKYKDVSISARQDGIVIQAFAELYDVETASESESGHSPS